VWTGVKGFGGSEVNTRGGEKDERLVQKRPRVKAKKKKENHRGICRAKGSSLEQKKKRLTTSRVKKLGKDGKLKDSRGNYSACVISPIILSLLCGENCGKVNHITFRE